MVIEREMVRPRGLSILQEQRAKEYLASHLSDDILIADVAKVCGLSRGHFTSAFRATAGVAPHEWLQLLRKQQAKTLLLESSISTAEIAVIAICLSEPFDAGFLPAVRKDACWDREQEYRYRARSLNHRDRRWRARQISDQPGAGNVTHKAARIAQYRRDPQHGERRLTERPEPAPVRSWIANCTFAPSVTARAIDRTHDFVHADRTRRRAESPQRGQHVRRMNWQP